MDLSKLLYKEKAQRSVYDYAGSDSLYDEYDEINVETQSYSLGKASHMSFSTRETRRFEGWTEHTLTANYNEEYIDVELKTPFDKVYRRFNGGIEFGESVLTWALVVKVLSQKLKDARFDEPERAEQLRKDLRRVLNTDPTKSPLTPETFAYKYFNLNELDRTYNECVEESERLNDKKRRKEERAARKEMAEEKLSDIRHSISEAAEKAKAALAQSCTSAKKLAKKAKDYINRGDVIR